MNTGKTRKGWIATIVAAAATVLFLTAGTAACSEADVTSENISNDADNFKIDRRIVFVNGITDEYLLVIEGKCSIDSDGTQLEVTCKIGPDEYKKHFLGLSDNVTYFVEQTVASDTDPYHYTVVFRPETIIPDIDVDTSGGSILPDPDEETDGN